MRIGSLFAGIGGLELGLERACVGHTIWQVEQDEYCRRILSRHWPGAVRYDDVRTVGAHNLEPADVICGGFPCQDLSYAGKGAGLAGARSGLWSEFARIIRELRPRYVVVENVPALLARGLGVVLGDLASCGYDAVWDCIPAAAVGAPHLRYRLFVVAYAGGDGCLPNSSQRQEPEARDEQPPGMRRYVELPGSHAWWARALARVDGAAEPVADAASGGRQAHGLPIGAAAPHTGPRVSSEDVADAEGAYEQPPLGPRPGAQQLGGSSRGEHPRGWSAEPGLGGLADGLPSGLAGLVNPWADEQEGGFPRVVEAASNRKAKLRALGNAVVPQVAEVVGRVLLQINEEPSQ